MHGTDHGTLGRDGARWRGLGLLGHRGPISDNSSGDNTTKQGGKSLGQLALGRGLAAAAASGAAVGSSALLAFDERAAADISNQS